MSATLVWSPNLRSAVKELKNSKSTITESAIMRLSLPERDERVVRDLFTKQSASKTVPTAYWV